MQLFHDLCEAGVKLRQIDIRKTKRKHADIVRLRAVISNILTKQYGLMTVEVGRMMGKDHSTIVHYRNLHTSRYRSDDEYALIYDSLSRIAMDKSFDHSGSIEDVLGLIRKIGE